MRLVGRIPVIRTVLRPKPCALGEGQANWFGTTSSPKAGPVIRQYFEEHLGAQVMR
jgi:hypothetical protein